MATLASKLVVSLLDRVTAPARAIGGSLGKLHDRASANNRAMNQMRGRMLDAAGVGYILAQAIAAPVRAAREFESSMADVNKVVDFAEPDGLKKMSANILAMSRRLPVAANGIADIVAAAGQAGMKGGELLAFAEIAAKVGVAFDISADETGEALAKIKTALGLTVDQTSELADVLNHLSNTSASSAPDLLNFMKRVGSVGLQYGFAARETAAFGSAMIAAGAPADVAATSFRNMGKALARGASATTANRRALKALGLDAKTVASSLQKDAVGTMQDVIARIRALPKEIQSSTVSDLFGDEARALMPLISNSGLLANALSEVASETKYLGSAQKEFEVRSTTFDARLQSFKNRLTEAAIAIGNALLPALSSLMDILSPLIGAITGLAVAYPQVTVAVFGLTAGLVALRVATLSARFAFLFLKGGALDAGMGVSRGAGLIEAGTKRMRLAVIAASMLSSVGGGGLFTGLAAGASAASGVIVATATAIGSAIAGVTLPIWGLIAAAAAVGLAIYRYWEPIKNFVAGFASSIGDALGPVVDALGAFAGEIASMVASWAGDRLVDIGSWLGIDEQTVRAALDRAKSVIGNAIGWIVEAFAGLPAAVGNWFSNLFSVKDYSDEAEAEFRDSGRRVGEALINGIKSAFQALWEFLSSIPARVREAIGSIDLTGLFSWPSMPEWLGGAPAAAVRPAIDGARAAGGPVVAGRTYRVNEKGDELYTPDRNGFIHSAASTKRILAGASGSPAAAPLSVSFGDIVIQGIQDPSAIADLIGAELEARLSGLQADSEWSVA
ncbi:phage tail tape measure protein [Roseibium algae]|uniref:Phage tail tape measure protein n=1 Tax=Roseibium algae TaxID=3123038 RepID=A0ABU8TJV5_9HYPH